MKKFNEKRDPRASGDNSPDLVQQYLNINSSNSIVNRNKAGTAMERDTSPEMRDILDELKDPIGETGNFIQSLKKPKRNSDG